MTIDFTAQTLQIYKVDTSSGKRELKALTDAERKYAEQALRGGEQAAKAHGKATKASGETTKSGKRLAQQMGILTMSIGGMGTEVGKAAEVGKRLSDGFGIMGVAMFGAGLALRELAPAVGHVITGLKDLLNIGSRSSDWTEFNKNLKDLQGEAKKLEDRLLGAQRALMDPFGRASSVAVVAAGAAGSAAGALSTARIAEAKATAELAAAEAQLGRAKEDGNFAEKTRLELEINLRSKLIRPLQQETENAKLLADATALEFEAAKKNLAIVPLIEKTTETKTKAIAKQAQAVDVLTAAELALITALKEEAAIRSGGVSGLGGLTGDKFSRAGTRAAGLLEIPETGFGKETPADLIDETAAAAKRLNDSRAFSMVSDNAVDMWEAIATGAMSAADATEKAFGAILLAGGKMLAGEAIKEGVMIFTDWSKAAIHAVAAAKAAAGATALFALAGTMGASGGAGVGGFSSGGGSSAPTPPEVHNYFLGDSYTGMSTRQLYSHQQRISSAGTRRTS